MEKVRRADRTKRGLDPVVAPMETSSDAQVCALRRHIDN